MIYTKSQVLGNWIYCFVGYDLLHKTIILVTHTYNIWVDSLEQFDDVALWSQWEGTLSDSNTQQHR